MGKTKQNKTLLLAVAVLVIAMAAFFMIHAVFTPPATEGAKTVTIEVVDNEEVSTSYELHTDALYLRQALEETEGLTFIRNGMSRSTNNPIPGFCRPTALSMPP